MSRPTVLLVPGGPGLGGVTLERLPLPPAWRRLAAESTCARGENPFAIQTERLIRLLGAVAGTGPVVVIAHSAGVRSALQAVARTPVPPAALVLIAAQLRDGSDRPELLTQRLHKMSGPLRTAARKALTTAPHDVPAGDAALRELLIADLALTMPHLGPAQRDFLDACEASWDLTTVRASFFSKAPEDSLVEPAGRIRTPVLIINGEEDPWAGRSSALELAVALADGTARLVVGGGHAPWLEDPGTVRQLLSGVLDEGNRL